MTPFERFKAKILIHPRGCWVWTGARKSDGYGTVKINGVMKLAHRYAYEQLIGPIPAGLTLDHFRCQRRGCVNPLHLEAVTVKVNTLRGAGPTAAKARQTACRYGHPLEGENLYTYQNMRHCRACQRATQRARYWMEKIRTRLGYGKISTSLFPN